MTKYCLGADEFALLSAEYDTYAIDFAYGLRMLQLCIESANDVFGERLGYGEFVDWLDELSQRVSEGFEYLARYSASSESSDDSPEQEGEDDAREIDEVQLSDLADLMQVVAESLETALDDSPAASIVFDASDEDEERLDHEVESVVGAVREVGYETYHFLIRAQYHWNKLTSSDVEKSILQDVTCLFGKKPVERELVHGSSEPRLPQVRAQVPGRFRAARADARVGSIKRRIERVFGLPEGSVALCGPDGKALRTDARIATLRRRWEQ
ncbi:hypothetical protein [Paraburkholderia rhynchosiae]|uniref:Uncharacterized protein n=1 Tax=Paraburkholderia rhynchosiae TaxID=487049 RepID=A0A2N7WLM5_9BURK|nr:hypothetical protein [Paraburkholderia rhynchosiae]PMS30303.1 hypothetical protein C0Z16_15245 [Paraburkholderia rhynchosiae]CAB3690756.1 hypothetical protein LMG27174_03155 [Paraburkholderia rhynchosiae]